MKHLVGRDFSLAEGRYRIVDVRQVGRDALVYAEPLERHDGAAGPARAAFHYEDIAKLLDAAPAAG
jgi:hypothetical protein